MQDEDEQAELSFAESMSEIAVGARMMAEDLRKMVDGMSKTPHPTKDRSGGGPSAKPHKIVAAKKRRAKKRRSR